MKKVLFTIALLTMAGSMVAMQDATAPKDETPAMTLNKETTQQQEPTSAVVAVPAKQSGKLTRVAKSPVTRAFTLGALVEQGCERALGMERKNAVYVGAGTAVFVLVAPWTCSKVKGLFTKKAAATAPASVEEKTK